VRLSGTVDRGRACLSRTRSPRTLGRVARKAVDIEVTLPGLSTVDSSVLEREGRYDGLAFRELDLGGQDAGGARFLECGIYACQLDRLELRQAWFTDCVLAGVNAGGLDIGESFWRGALITDPRVGGLTADGVRMERVRFGGGKVDFLNLRGAKLTTVRFEGCRLGEVDLGGARVKRVAFVDCEVERLDVNQAKLEQVDLSGARIGAIAGVSDLGGATINRDQLTDLATAFAENLGITVVDNP
jgi:uncharacterized protein YjbI with pentapeptide repeats